MITLERIDGHYEVQDVEFGQVYKWCPECVVIECECGERATLTSSMSTCECGVDHTEVIRGELAARRSGDDELHPWRYAGDRESAGLPF